MRNKEVITRALLNQISADKRPGIEWALKNWWVNPRMNSGMRLSLDGQMLMQKLSIESWKFSIDKNKLRPKLLLLLDQRLQDPYYLITNRNNPSIEFYGSKEVSLLNLYGDLDRFLENYL